MLTDEACEALMRSKPRLIKVSTLLRPSPPPALHPHGRQPPDGSSVVETGEAPVPPKNRPSRGVMRRLSLGVSKKTLTDVFASDPSPRRNLRRQSANDVGAHSAGASFSATNTSTPRARGGGQAQAQHQRQALFGKREAVGDGKAGEAAAGRAAGGLGETHAAVSEARDLAIERGEKLENLVDKSRELEDSAMAFGDMAKQLRRQQEDEACCIS